MVARSWPTPRQFLGRVVLPEAISWAAMVGTIAVFLAAYKIPVSFHTLMRVVGGNSIANSTSVTPGGAGVQQGFNVLSLKGVTSSAERHRVLGGPAAGDDGLEHHLRRPPARRAPSASSRHRQGAGAAVL